VPAHGLDPDGAAVAVVAGIVDVLDIEGEEETLPGVPGVVALDNVLASIVQAAIAEQKTEAAVLQIILVIFLMALLTKAVPILSAGRCQRAPA